jgi:hypothetical protein
MRVHVVHVKPRTDPNVYTHHYQLSLHCEWGINNGYPRDCPSHSGKHQLQGADRLV